MFPAKIEGETRPIGKPSGWDDDKAHCATIHVRDEKRDGLAFMISAWEASDIDAGWLLAGSKIHLGVSAPQHPVVNMGVGPRLEEFEPVYTVKPLPHPAGLAFIRVTRFAPTGAVYADAQVHEGAIPPAFARAILAIEKFISEIPAKE